MNTKLDLKYRPRKFSDVVGNDGVRKLLLIRSNRGSLDHQSMMFGGPKGCGKTSLARIVARAIICQSKTDGEPCNECDSCIDILRESSLNVQEIDAATLGTVDKIRGLVNDLNYEIIGSSQRRVVILDEAHRLSKPAQDALLKVVEDRNIIIILCTTEPNKIQGPLRDRLEEYPIYNPKESEITGRLRFICESESIEYDVEALSIIAQMNFCAPRSCILCLSSIALFGRVDVAGTKEFLNFENYESVNSIISNITLNFGQSLKELDALSSKESPTWIRNTIVDAINNYLRTKYNLTSKFPIKLSFEFNDISKLSSFACNLMKISKPIISDIESSFLNFKLSDEPNLVKINQPKTKPRVLDTDVILTPEESTQVVELLKNPPEPTPVLVAAFKMHKPIPGNGSGIPKISNMKCDDKKTMEIDGVKFSSSENLTTLDSKVMVDNIGDLKTSIDDKEIHHVLLDRSRAPISEKEFVSGLIRRVKQ